MKHFTLWGGALLLALPALASPPQVQVPMASGTVEFVANRQQWNSSVLFATDLPAGRMYLEQGRLVQALYDGKQVDELQHHGDKLKDYPVKAHAYSTTFVGANPEAAVKGESQLPGYSNFFLGNDPKHWASKVPGFAGVRYQALYPGIDLHFYGKKALEYDFEVAAGADASRIALRYTGQTKLSVVNGALHIGTSVGTVVEQKPFAYQLVDGQRQRVACDYVLGEKNTVTFRLAQGYNHALPLVIDPVLVYATYTGSSASNYGFTATYDTLGNVYSGGNVFSSGYPVSLGAYQTTYKNGTDIGLIKYNPRAATGPQSRVWATYLGGGSTEQPHSLIVDRFGNLIVMGSSQSNDYPMLGSAYSSTLKGTYDIVITKFTDDGAILRGSTYLGGTGVDGYMASGAININYGDHSRGDLAVDRAGNIYVASLTASNNYPVTTGVGQATYGGGAWDGVVTKLNSSLSALVWSTYIGGSGEDGAYSMQIDSNNNVFVSGGTTSTNLPATTGAFKPTYAGGSTDGFVTRLSSTGAFVRTTYLGTTAYDQAYLLQLDNAGAVYAFGQTAGAYPVSAGVYSNAGSKNFLQKLDGQLTTSIWSTVIGNGSAGASPSMSPTALSVTDCGNILLSGWTGQSGYPITSDALQSTGPTSTSSTTTSFSPGWFYVAQLAANATALTYATYYGNGSCHVDGGTSRFDKKGNVYQSMCVGTSGGNITTTTNAWSRTNGSSWNNGTFKMDVAPLSVVFTPSVVQLGPRQQQGCAPQRFYFARASSNGTAAWDFGNNTTGTGNTTSAVYNTPGIYIVKLTVTDNTQGCNQMATAVDTVKVYGIPPAALGPDKTICPGGSTTLSIPNQGAGVTYSWTPAAGLNMTTGNSVVATPSVSTDYIITVTAAGGCTSRDTIRVNVSAPPSASAGPDKTICANGSTTLEVPDAGPGATYLWSPATGLSSTTSRTVTARPTASTQYTVRVTTSGGCSSTGTISVNIAPAPLVAIRSSVNNVLPGTSITFSAAPQNNTSPITAYVWNFGDGKGTSTAANPSYAYTQSGSYQVGLTVSYGPSCSESSVLPITIRQFQLPNVITPNGDKLNDTFKPTVSDNPVNIEIYDRWGRKVFEQQNYAGSWGSEEGTAPGIYYYKISATSGETWKGWLEVIK